MEKEGRNKKLEEDEDGESGGRKLKELNENRALLFNNKGKMRAEKKFSDLKSTCSRWKKVKESVKREKQAERC